MDKSIILFIAYTTILLLTYTYLTLNYNRQPKGKKGIVEYIVSNMTMVITFGTSVAML